jgi:hypothetical protein
MSLRELYTSPPRSVQAETEETMPDTQPKKLKLELSESPNVDLEQSSSSDQDEPTENNPMPSAVDQPESVAALQDIQVDEPYGSKAAENRQPEDSSIEVLPDEVIIITVESLIKSIAAACIFTMKCGRRGVLCMWW